MAAPSVLLEILTKETNHSDPTLSKIGRLNPNISREEKVLVGTKKLLSDISTAKIYERVFMLRENLQKDTSETKKWFTRNFDFDSFDINTTFPSTISQSSPMMHMNPNRPVFINPIPQQNNNVISPINPISIISAQSLPSVNQVINPPNLRMSYQPPPKITPPINPLPLLPGVNSPSNLQSEAAPFKLPPITSLNEAFTQQLDGGNHLLPKLRFPPSNLNEGNHL